jgi:hypothetical protein
MWNDYSDAELIGLAITYGIPCAFDPATNTLYYRQELEAALTECEHNLAFNS